MARNSDSSLVLSWQLTGLGSRHVDTDLRALGDRSSDYIMLLYVALSCGRLRHVLDRNVLLE